MRGKIDDRFDLEKRIRPLFSSYIEFAACAFTTILGLIGIIFTLLDFIREK